MIYILIILTLLFFAFYFDFGEAKIGKEFIFYLVLLGLICLSGFRYRVGGDTLLYMLRHEGMPTLGELRSLRQAAGKLQPFWTLVVAVSKSITPDFYMVQFLHAIIVNTLIFHFIKAHTKYVFTAIFLYFIGYYGYFNFEILRESLAISVFLFSIKFLLNKKWIHYYLLALTAFLFHVSAIILFFIPLLIKIKYRFWVALVIFCVGVVFSGVFGSFVGKVNLAGSFFTSMKVYVDYNSTIFGLLSLLIFKFLYPASIYKLSSSHLKIKSDLFSLMSTYIYIGASTALFYIFYRFLNYLTPVLFIFLTEVIHEFSKKIELRANKLALIFLLLFSISIIHMNSYFTSTSKYVTNSRWYSYWYPYHTIFDKKVDLTRERLIKSQNEF